MFLFYLRLRGNYFYLWSFYKDVTRDIFLLNKVIINIFSSLIHSKIILDISIYFKMNDSSDDSSNNQYYSKFKKDEMVIKQKRKASSKGNLKLILFKIKTSKPWSCGSIMSGQRSQLVKIVAFSILIRSPGKPSLFQPAISASSIKRVKTSKSGVIGMGVFKSKFYFKNWQKLRIV